MARLLALLALCGCLVFYVSAFRNALIDDAFIQLKYSQTLATSATWGFFPDRITNTATSPLNVVLTAAVSLVSPSMIDAVVWLTAFEFLLIFIFLRLIAATLFGEQYFCALAFVGLTTNPLLLSTIGLEGVLFTLWMVASLYFFVSQRCLVLAATLGFLTLTRADGFLLFAVVVVVLPVPMKTKCLFALVYALVLAPWHVYSWIHLGSIIPDTMKIKVHQRAWSESMTFSHGPLLYLRAFPLAATFAFGMLPFGVLALGRSDRRVRAVLVVLAAYGILHFIAYSTIGVPPYHWYYVQQVVPCVLIGALGLSCLFRRTAAVARLRRVVLRVGVFAPAAGILVIAYRDGFQIREMPIHSNWATHDTYKTMGLWLRDHTAPSDVIFCAGEIGTMAFYSDRYLINEFSDMNRISESLVNGTYNRLPIVGPLIRINYYWRRMQEPRPDPRYMLRGAAVSNDKKVRIVKESIKTWDVSSTFMDWLVPDRTMFYSFKAL